MEQGRSNTDSLWVLTLSGEHVQVMRAALILAIRLHDLEIDFVCGMFSFEHAGDVETERQMAERFALSPDEAPCRALREAFADLLQAALQTPPSEADLADLRACLEKINNLSADRQDWVPASFSTSELASLRTACELLARLAIGQGWVVAGYLGCPEHAADAVLEFDRRYREIFFPELRGDAYYGINSQLVHDNARVAWDILQVVRQHLAFDAVGKSVGRDKRDVRIMRGPEFDDPMQRSRLELVRCSKIPGNGSADSNLLWA